MYPISNGTFDDEYIKYLLDTYSDMLIRLCFSYTKNIHDAEDMAQDVFVELIKRKPSFESAEHEKAWIIRTGVNKCKNLLKSSHKRMSVPLEDEINDQNFCNNDNDIDDEAKTVLDAVMSLPAKYRVVVHMFYYQGMTIKEISAATKAPIPTVGTRLSRAKTLLKQTLGDDFLDE